MREKAGEQEEEGKRSKSGEENAEKYGTVGRASSQEIGGLLLMLRFNRRATFFPLYSNTFSAILVSFSCEMAQLSPSQMKAEKMVGGCSE